MARIILAENTDLWRERIKNSLERAGHEVVTVCDGIDAWRIFKQGDTSFAIVISDNQMPRMCGTDLLRNMRRRGDKHTAEMPFLLISSDPTSPEGHSLADFCAHFGATFLEKGNGNIVDCAEKLLQKTESQETKR